MIQFKSFSVQIKFMNGSYGVLLSDRIIINHCLSHADDLESSVYNKDNSEFCSFLKQCDPPRALITSRIKDSVIDFMHKKLRYDRRKNNCFQRFYGLGKHVIVKNISYNKFGEILPKIEGFFDEFRNQNCNGKINLTQISPSYRNLIRGIYGSEKTLLAKPEAEDGKLLYEAVCLSKEYQPLFLASLDEHFSGEIVSKALKERFDIIPGYPQGILQEIKEHEQSLLK